MVSCLVILGVLAAAAPALAPPAGGPSTTRVSVDSTGTQGNDFSGDSTMSADGRLAAFHSEASNLVAGDTNGALDVFAHDRQTGETTRVSVASDGAQGNDESRFPAISADGRFVAFESFATNLVAGDTNDESDVFLHDLQTDETTRVSVASDAGQGNSESRDPAISADGRFVAFESFATNLVAGDTDDGNVGIYVRDRQDGQTTKVSVDSSGAGGDDGLSLHPSISDDGRFVVFDSGATDLVVGDANGEDDVFVHDRDTAETTSVSVDGSGGQGNGDSNFPAINADGRFVTFQSNASNLVAGDANGVLDAFVHDRQTGETTIASVTSTGAQGNGNSGAVAISADGGSVAFHSNASNLVAGDTNGVLDVFVHDRGNGQTTRVSVDSSGAEGNASSRFADISADGRFVAFHSNASNLVAGDTNSAVDVFVHDRGEAFAALEVIANGPTRAAAGDRTIAARVTNRGATPLMVSDTDVDWFIRVGASACDGSGNLSTGAVVAKNPGSTTLGPGQSTTFRYQWTYGTDEVSPGTGVAYRAVFTPFGWAGCEFQVAR
jgi:hypothetical protein